MHTLCYLGAELPLLRWRHTYRAVTQKDELDDDSPDLNIHFNPQSMLAYEYVGTLL